MSNVEKMMELIRTKKAKVTSKEEIEQVEYLEKVMANEQLYDMLAPNVFMGILQFLDVPEKEIESVYAEMIIPSDLKKKKPEVRKIIGE